jgi:hypothetical protein
MPEVRIVIKHGEIRGGRVRPSISDLRIRI